MSNLITKRFVVRQSLIGKNVTFEFTNKKGDTITYNHDKVFFVFIMTIVKLVGYILILLATASLGADVSQ